MPRASMCVNITSQKGDELVLLVVPENGSAIEVSIHILEIPLPTSTSVCFENWKTQHLYVLKT